MSSSYYILESEENSALEGNAPTSTQINAVFNGINPTGGAWVGPRTRITRVLHTLSPTAGFTTRASRLLRVDNPISGQTASDTAAFIGSQLDFGLAFQSGDWTRTSVTPWSEGVNGPVSWWESGSAAITQTENDFPTVAGRLDPNENPIGPTTALTHPGTVGGAIQSASGSLTTIGLVILGIVALYAIAPLLRGTRRAKIASGEIASVKAAERRYRLSRRTRK